MTYAAIIDAPNPALKLKPGMTANVTIEVARRDAVLRVPAAALRFKPDAAVLARFGGRSARRRPAGQQPCGCPTGPTIAPVAVTTGASDGAQTVNRERRAGARRAGRDPRVLDRGVQDGQGVRHVHRQPADARRARPWRAPWIFRAPVCSCMFLLVL